MILGRVGPIYAAFLFVCISRIVENKDAKKYCTFRYRDDEINIILNNSVLNVKIILHLCNGAWDTKNDSMMK